MELISAVKEYKEGNKEAFSDIYEESNRYVYACIYKVLAGNDNAQDLINDVMQDTYIEISQSIGQLENPDKFLSWAGMIATRKCYAIVAKNKKYVLNNEDETFDDIPDDYSLIPEEVMDNKEKLNIIRDIIDKELTPMQKICVVAYYYNEQKQGDIAKELNIPENTVKTNLSRAKQKIKEAVLTIEKKEGTKLYSFAPFMLLLFRNEIMEAVVPGAVTESILGASGVSVGAGSVSSIAKGVEVAAKGAKVAGAGAKAASVGMSAKAIVISILVGIGAVGAIGGGVYAVTQLTAEEAEEETPKKEKKHKDKDEDDKEDVNDIDEEIVDDDDEEVVEEVDYSYLINHADHLLTYYQNGIYQNTDMDASPLYNPEFALADLNYDGYLDLVITGYTGFSSIQNSEICIFDGKALNTQLTGDCAYYYNEDVIWFEGTMDSTYYTDESRAFDSWEIGYKLDSSGNLVEKYHSYYSEEIAMTDMWESLGVIEESYKIDGVEVSKDEYEDSSSKAKESTELIDYASLDLETVVDYFMRYGIDLSVLDQSITGDEYVVTSQNCYVYNIDYYYFENTWGSYYTYDENWNLTNERGTAGGLESYNIYWEYDDNGNVIYTNEGDVRQTEECDDTYAVRDYDDKGREISWIQYFDDGSICSWCTYEYDDMNLLTTSTSYNPDGSVYQIIKYEYDDERMEINRITYDANGQVIRTCPREYDDFGRQTRFGNEYYEYDVFGNLVKYSSRNENGDISYYIEYTYTKVKK